MLMQQYFANGPDGDLPFTKNTGVHRIAWSTPAQECMQHVTSGEQGNFMADRGIVTRLGSGGQYKPESPDLDEETMKAATVAILAVSTSLTSPAILAGEFFAIKAYGRPQALNFTSTSNRPGIDVKAEAAINCNGTTTSNIRIWGDATNSQLTEAMAANASFLDLSEVISAAKNGYLVETAGTPAFNESKGGCNVYEYFIHIQ